MRWVFSLPSTLLFCFILSCADHKVEDAKVTQVSGNVLTSIGNRVITVNDYIEVLSAVQKITQNSEEKKVLIINFFKKIDKNKLFLRLFDIY